MYTPPPVTGILFASGQGAPQQLAEKSLCTLAEAQFIQRIFGGLLINAAGDPQLGTFTNLDPLSKYQPWVLLNASGGWDGTFVGPRVAEMNGIDTDGKWSGIGAGNPKFTPTPPPPPQPQPVPDSSHDADTMLAVLTGGASKAPGATGGGSTAAEDSALARIESKLDAILAWDHIPYPPK